MAASRIWPQAFIALLLVLAMVSSARMVTNTIAPEGGKDFHAYWYAGTFVRQWADPYGAFVAGRQPEVPMSFLDGQVAPELPIAQPGLSLAPANTPIFVLLVTPLSFLSWPYAKLVWGVLSIALVAAIAWGTPKAMPIRLPPQTRLALGLLFVALLSTRVAVGNGQSTLIVFALMIGALTCHQRGRAVLSGLLAGLALSKYSLSLPILGLLLYRRDYKAVSVALAVQATGSVLLAAISRINPIELVQSVAIIGLMHAPQEGINAASVLGSAIAAQLGVVIAVTAITAAAMWQVVKPRLRVPGEIALENYILLSLSSIWILLVSYHRVYDAAVSYLAITLAVAALHHQGAWGLHTSNLKLLQGVIGASIVLLLLPGEAFGVLVPGWGSLANPVTLAALVLLCSCSSWLVHRWASKLPGLRLRDS